MDEKKDYYNVLTEIWKLFRADLETVRSINSAEDAEWTEMIARYQAVADNAPMSVRAYATDMMLVHVAALEAKWRWKD